MIGVSFEFFPPQSEQARDNLLSCADDLAQFEPSFVSVTYGAGGSSQDRTIQSLADLTGRLSVPVAGHLTTVGASAESLQRIIDDYQSLGVEHIVALRGDPTTDGPKVVPDGGRVDGLNLDGYATAADLVAAIRARPDGDRFQISVAAYPEVHPKALSAEADLDNLKRKIDAGADRAITQFFFDPDVFSRFVDQARAAGIEAPIVPGIMPVTNFAGLRRFADRCGAVIPDWMTTLLGGLDDDPEVHQLSTLR